jgi:hypothetical protein
MACERQNDLLRAAGTDRLRRAARADRTRRPDEVVRRRVTRWFAGRFGVRPAC